MNDLLAYPFIKRYGSPLSQDAPRKRYHGPARPDKRSSAMPAPLDAAMHEAACRRATSRNARPRAPKEEPGYTSPDCQRTPIKPIHESRKKYGPCRRPAHRAARTNRAPL